MDQFCFATASRQGQRQQINHPAVVRLSSVQAVQCLRGAVEVAFVNVDDRRKKKRGGDSLFPEPRPFQKVPCERKLPSTRGDYPLDKLSAGMADGLSAFTAKHPQGSLCPSRIAQGRGEVDTDIEITGLCGERPLEPPDTRHDPLRISRQLASKLQSYGLLRSKRYSSIGRFESLQLFTATIPKPADVHPERSTSGVQRQ